MKKEIYFKPLKKYLSENITPEQLAQLLDELAYDYFRLIICHYEDAEEAQLYIHYKTKDIIYHLKELRGALLQCKSNKFNYSKISPKEVQTSPKESKLVQ